jgi:hypothetical protein
MKPKIIISAVCLVVIFVVWSNVFKRYEKREDERMKIQNEQADKLDEETYAAYKKFKEIEAQIPTWPKIEADKWYCVKVGTPAEWYENVETACARSATYAENEMPQIISGAFITNWGKINLASDEGTSPMWTVDYIIYVSGPYSTQQECEAHCK